MPIYSCHRPTPTDGLGARVVACQALSDATRKDQGFTLVALMVVVLIIGILVTIADPVHQEARAMAESKSCQANQRTILSAIEVARAADVNFATASGGSSRPAVRGGTPR